MTNDSPAAADGVDSAAVNQHRPPRRGVLHWIGTIIVVAAVLAEIALMAMFVDHGRMPHGERRAFGGMGLIMLFGAALWVIVPGTLIAWVRAVLAAIALRAGEPAGVRLAFYLIAGLMPALMWWTLVQSGRPPKAPAPKPTSAVEQRTAGRAWAIDAGITSEAACNAGTPDFVDGCRSYVRQLPR